MSIYMILGPMYSGKTTLLMQKVYRAEHGNQECMVIKHRDDNRFGPPDQLVNRSHHAICDTERVKVVRPKNNLSELGSVTQFKIFIDEGQFFPDLAKFCLDQAKRGAEVVVAALDFNSDQKPFKSVIELMPYANYEKVTAICKKCRILEAPITRRKDGRASVLEVGDTDYTVLCIRCAF